MDYLLTFKRIKNAVFIFGVLFTISGIVSQLSLMSNVGFTHSMNRIQERDRGEDVAGSIGAIEFDEKSTYKQRQTHIQAVCKQIVGNLDAVSSHYCNIPGTNISYCKVPKCGSTLWIQILNILTYGVENMDTFMKARRFDLHRNYSCKMVKPSSDTPLKTIIVTRDPFSRLYSAYVDKSYTTFRTQKGDATLKNLDEKCSGFSDLNFETFQHFLDRRLVEIHNDDCDYHWTPIHKLCLPCSTDVFIHVKLEEFSKDMKFVFSQLGFSDELQNALTKLSVNKIDSLTGVAATLFLKKENQTCLPKDEIAARLWNSFQIQGYIRVSSTFPRNDFQAIMARDRSLSETEAVMKLVSAEMSDRPLSKDASLNQRHTMLVNAYSQIRPETIASIQDAFKLDFLIFDYSMLPPTK